MAGLGSASRKRTSEAASNLGFRMMTGTYNLVDLVYPHVGKRIRNFGVIEMGMTVVDYGCGPGRYALKLAGMVGSGGKVYAVDIHKLAMATVRKRMDKEGIKNIEPVLAEGYNSTLPDNIADVIFALDMFFIIKEPGEFLAELKRIIKPDGWLIIDDGHQPRSLTREKIIGSGLWDIVVETKGHLNCKPCEADIRPDAEEK